MLDFETSNSKSDVSKSNSWKTTSFSKTMSLQREPSHQVRFNANNYFEYLPKVSTAFKFGFETSDLELEVSKSTI